MPENINEWTSIADGFEKNCGYPDVAGANWRNTWLKSSVPRNTKGTIKAFIDAVGEWRFNLESYRWYCREKTSLQSICRQLSTVKLDYGLFNATRVLQWKESMEYVSNRPKRHWDYSSREAFSWRRSYTLTNAMMIPYNITEDMPRGESKFNYLHSCTRICV